MFLRFTSFILEGLQRAGFVAILLASLHLSLTGQAYAADIRSTKHNLGGQSAEGTLDERRVCVFCHTPRVDLGANTGQTTKPHWQSSQENHSFVIYDDIGRVGRGNSISVGTQSMACLSCHDAVQAFAATGSQADHPFGVPYRGAMIGKDGKPSWDREVAPFREAQHLKALEDFRMVSSGVVEDRTIWWVSQGGVTTRRTRSDLPLYGRVDRITNLEDIPFVECSSCHDPHTANNQMFLRVANEGSQLCLTCHIK